MAGGTVRRCWVVGVIVLGGGLVIAPAAQAKKVQCGETITENTKVSNSLEDCPGDGLVIGADDITLDLNGNTIDGTENGVGVQISNHDGVTVKNGTIRQFVDGVLLIQSSENLIKNIASNHNVGGLMVVDSSDNRLINNTARHNDELGLSVESNSDDNILRRNVADKGDDVGIHVGSGATGTVILANRATRNANDGILINANDNGTSIAKNRADDNGELGIDAEAGTDDAGGNRAQGNGNPLQCTGVACS